MGTLGILSPPILLLLSPAINHHLPVLRSPTVWSRLQGHRLSLTLIWKTEPNKTAWIIFCCILTQTRPRYINKQNVVKASSHLLFFHKGSTVYGPQVWHLHPVATLLREDKARTHPGWPFCFVCGRSGKEKPGILYTWAKQALPTIICNAHCFLFLTISKEISI